MCTHKGPESSVDFQQWQVSGSTFVPGGALDYVFEGLREVHAGNDRSVPERRGPVRWLSRDPAPLTIESVMLSILKADCPGQLQD